MSATAEPKDRPLAASIEPFVLNLRQAAVFVNEPYDTLKKGWKTMLPKPVVEKRDRLGRNHKVQWLRSTLAAWVEAGKPEDVATFDATLRRKRSA